MIKRLRPKWSDEELVDVYSKQYNHEQWKDHVDRIRQTVMFALIKMPRDESINTVADLSAGDGAIINALPYETKILGDFYPAFEYCGKIEDTVEQIQTVDLFILSETLEHLDNPLEVLKQIRKKTKYLLLSTPQNNWGDENPEHYWAWDKEGVEELLKESGFEPIAFMSEKLWYIHQYWIAK